MEFARPLQFASPLPTGRTSPPPRAGGVGPAANPSERSTANAANADGACLNRAVLGQRVAITAPRSRLDAVDPQRRRDWQVRLGFAESVQVDVCVCGRDNRNRIANYVVRVPENEHGTHRTVA